MIREVGSIDGIELIVKRQVGAVDAYLDQVIHGHADHFEPRLHVVHYDPDFLLDILGWCPRLWVRPDRAGQIERVTHQNGVAEGSVVAPPR